MTAANWRHGHLCRKDEEFGLEKAVLVAEVHSGSLSPDDGGLVATYFLAHGLEDEEAERAMTFFADNVRLLVDVERLVDDVGAEAPALVTIRYSDQAADYLATAYEWDLLRELPSDEVISTEGWDLFWAYDALRGGRDAPTPSAFPIYDARTVQRQVLLNRAAVEEDRTPWLLMERSAIEQVLAKEPEGAAPFKAKLEDIDAVLNGAVETSQRFSVVVVTSVEHRVQRGPIPDWVPYTGREIVVAHGLDGVQAAYALKFVQDEPLAYLRAGELLNEERSREKVVAVLAILDSAMNWISTDLERRRDPAGYGRLQSRLPASAIERVGAMRQAAGAER